MISKKERKQNIKEFWDNITEIKKIDGEYNIPDLPKFDNQEDYKNIIVKNLIRLGAITKDKLIIGKTYLGNCRNTNKATWNGTQFIYDRYKFGSYYQDNMNHFQDDDGYDLFVPMKLLE